MKKLTDKERFLCKVNQTNGCWTWTSAATRHGYGAFRFRGKTVGAHRVSYELFKGQISDGMDVCHRCDNPACVNPEHLFVGSRLENMRDASSKARTSCGSGRPNHKLSEQDVLEIRRLWVPGTRSGPNTRSALAKRFGVHQTVIYRAATGRKWARAA